MCITCSRIRYYLLSDDSFVNTCAWSILTRPFYCFDIKGKQKSTCIKNNKLIMKRIVKLNAHSKHVKLILRTYPEQTSVTFGVNGTTAPFRVPFPDICWISFCIATIFWSKTLIVETLEWLRNIYVMRKRVEPKIRMVMHEKKIKLHT